MEFFIILIIILAVTYFIAKSGKKRTDKIPVTITTERETHKSSSNFDDYEDPYDSYEQKQNDEIFTTDFTFFYALNNRPETFNYIEEKYHSLAKTLSEQKNENVQNAVYELLNQVYFKSVKGLPKYLQVVPIKSLLSQNIFVYPTNADYVVLLNSLTMDTLKDYCNKFGIKPARSKKETVERLLKTDIKSVVDLKQYFKLNPHVRKIYYQFGDYSHVLLKNGLDKKKIRIKDVNKKLNSEDLGDEIKKGDYSLQEYGYQSIVFFKNKNPIFRIMGITIDKWNDCVILFNDGRLGIVQYLGIDKWIMMQLSIIDEDKNILARYQVKDLNSYNISELEDKPYIFQDLNDWRYWVLNYETLEERYLENPNELDIYSLIENKW